MALTIRDYFAARAMQALIPPEGYRVLYDAKQIAEEAYALADLMILEREKRSGTPQDR